MSKLFGIAGLLLLLSAGGSKGSQQTTIGPRVVSGSSSKSLSPLSFQTSNDLITVQQRRARLQSAVMVDTPGFEHGYSFSNSDAEYMFRRYFATFYATRFGSRRDLPVIPHTFGEPILRAYQTIELGPLSFTDHHDSAITDWSFHSANWHHVHRLTLDQTLFPSLTCAWRLTDSITGALQTYKQSLTSAVENVLFETVVPDFDAIVNHHHRERRYYDPVIASEIREFNTSQPLNLYVTRTDLTAHLEDVLTTSRLHAQVSNDYVSTPLEVSSNPVQAGEFYVHPIITPVDLNEVVTIVSNSPIFRFLAGSERSVKTAFKQVPELFEVASRTIQGHRSEYLLWPGINHAPELYVTQIPHSTQHLYQLFARDYSFEVGVRALAGTRGAPGVANHVVRDIQTRPILLGIVTRSVDTPVVGVTTPLVPYHEYYSSYGSTQRDVSAFNFIGGLDFRPQVVQTVNSYSAVLEQFVPNNVSARLASYSGQNIGIIQVKTLNQRLNVDNSIDFGKHKLANETALHSVDSTISFNPGHIPTL